MVQEALPPYRDYGNLESKPLYMYRRMLPRINLLLEVSTTLGLNEREVTNMLTLERFR